MTEQKITDALSDFTGQMRKVAESVLSDIYTEYLPFVSDDTMLNARHIAKSEIDYFLDERKSLKSDMFDFSNYTARDIRKAILKHNRDEIESAIIEDQQKEIERLNKLIESLEDMLNRSH